MRTSRRRFLLGIAVLGGTGTAGTLAANQWLERREDVWSELAVSLLELSRAEDLGVEYLATHPEEGESERLVQTLSSAWDGAWWPTLEAAARQVRRRVRQDFADGDILRVGGWLLSRTTLRLCALGVVTARAGSGDPLGLFAPEKSPEGAVRWTCPSVTIPWPADAAQFELPVRSMAPFAQRVAVLLDGLALSELHLADHEWQRVEMDRPASYADRELRLELRIEPVWMPRGDFRTLGVQTTWGAQRTSP